LKKRGAFTDAPLFGIYIIRIKSRIPFEYAAFYLSVQL